jgi:hypothetical protein
MKRIILLLLLVVALVAPGITNAQTIPNGDFEDWTTNSQPNNWKVVSGSILQINGVQYTKTGTDGSKTSVFRPVYDGQYGVEIQNKIVGTSASLGIIEDSFSMNSQRPNYFAANISYFPGLQGESPVFVLFFFQHNIVTGKRDTVLYQAIAGGNLANFFEPWINVN